MALATIFETVLDVVIDTVGSVWIDKVAYRLFWRKRLHMVVEQTYDCPMRMIYNPKDKTFTASDQASLMHERGFTKPYGWIKEFGDPPKPHRDCMLMTDQEYFLGDIVKVKVIGMFKRKDHDHKFIVVESSREINDYSELTDSEKEELSRLYPRIDEGEGWFGSKEAEKCMIYGPKAL